MTDLRINNNINIYSNAAFLSSHENDEKIDTNEAVQSSSQESDNKAKGSKSSSSKYPTPSGIRTWEEWERFINEFMGHLKGLLKPAAYNEFIGKLKDSFEKGEPLSYDSLISLLENFRNNPNKYLVPGVDGGRLTRFKNELNNAINALKGEKATWEKFGKEETNRKIDSLKQLIQTLEAYLLRSLSPADLQKIKDMIESLKEKITLLEDIAKLSGPDIIKKLQESEGSIKDLLRDIDKLRESLRSNPKDDDKDSSPILPPNYDIPLEDGETVRNQKSKGHGIGRASGASNYLKAFFAFSQTCNKLITMNAAWGIQLGELQKAATKLSLSGQEALNKSIKKEVDSFNDKSPHKISELQGWISQLQNDFGAYQKKLDTVMPLILEQPKNITKDLDKFLEAAKSILQLVTAYANFRI